VVFHRPIAIRQGLDLARLQLMIVQALGFRQANLAKKPWRILVDVGKFHEFSHWDHEIGVFHTRNGGWDYKIKPHHVGKNSR